MKINKNVGCMKIIFFVALIITISGCNQQTGSYQVEIAASHINNATQVYLLPAIDSDYSNHELNNTTYTIFLNGYFVGKWNASYLPIIIYNQSNPTTNETIIFKPYDKFVLLVESSGAPYNEIIKTEVSDSPYFFIRPKMNIPVNPLYIMQLYDDDTFPSIEGIDNRTVNLIMNPMDEHSLYLFISDNNNYNYVCCNIMTDDVSIRLYGAEGFLIQRELTPDRSCYDAYKLQKGKKMTLKIKSNEFFSGKSQLTCTLYDEVLTLNKYGEPNAITIDEDGFDVGLPNHKIDIVIGKK